MRQDSAVTPSTHVESGGENSTLVCFSHLRWDFVFQRPQHLMSRFARRGRVIFWEEPILATGLEAPYLEIRLCQASGVEVVVPRLREEDDRATDQSSLRTLLDGAVASATGTVILWYYTPMMLSFSDHLVADCIVYDCMDELANFKNAPPELIPLEQRLLDRADLVFTGGYSLYEAKRDRHPNIHPFPSSVDVAHFSVAREPGVDPADQVELPGPRLGYYGVVDERMDLGLLAALADARPHWSIVIVGPVVKIDEADLPRRANLHFLGGKTYEELPLYLRGWGVALMPFAINEATRFISPTKTPEYLAAGRPVVSTPVTDVVRHYGDVGAVHIADGADAFLAACEQALLLRRQSDWWDEVDSLLSTSSWDRTQAAMAARIDEALNLSRQVQPVVSPTHWPTHETGRYDVMIVGAGFAGAVMAERLASQSGKRVLVVDRRPHIAGNAFDHRDAAGILIHQYGPHIFHTNSEQIFTYLSKFTEWNPYEHRVLADVAGQQVPMPINRTTLNMLYGLDLRSDDDAAAYLAGRAEPVAEIRSSADVVISAVGRELYETFFQGYTRKQWGTDPSNLDKSVTARVPTRTNTDDRYFTDDFQFMPADGYTRMFERMLDHPNIDLLLGVDYVDAQSAYPHDHLVFTGPIDEYFGHCYGKLPYRSLRFEHRTLEQPHFQPVAVVNYPDEAVPYTRITEYKHMTGQEAPSTSLTYEYPSDEGDPYYPVPRAENQALFKRYEALALAETDVTFVGRLATYRYYNMDQVVGQALSSYRRLAERFDGLVAVAAEAVAA